MATCANSGRSAPLAPGAASFPGPPPAFWKGDWARKREESPAAALGRSAPGRARAGIGGFTLLEVLIALAILSLCLVAIYQGYTSTLAISASTRKLWKAMEYSHNELARWERMNPVPEVSVSQGEFPPGDPMAGYSWKREITDLEPLPSIKVRRIRLDLFWTLGTTAQTYRSSIYVLPQ